MIRPKYSYWLAHHKVNLRKPTIAVAVVVGYIRRCTEIIPIPKEASKHCGKLYKRKAYAQQLTYQCSVLSIKLFNKVFLLLFCVPTCML